MKRRGFSTGIVVLLLFLLTGCSQGPDGDRIKADLIGQQIGANNLTWKFDAVSEFQQFDIKAKKQDGPLLQFTIAVQLKPSSGPMGAADLVVVYRKEGSRWKLSTVTDNGTLRQLN